MTPSTENARPARRVPVYGETYADEHLRAEDEIVTELDNAWVNLSDGSRMKRRAPGCP